MLDLSPVPYSVVPLTSGIVPPSAPICKFVSLYAGKGARCHESRVNLLAACVPARRLGMVCRALTWRRVASSPEGPLREEHTGAAPGWLQELLNAETQASV